MHTGILLLSLAYVQAAEPPGAPAAIPVPKDWQPGAYRGRIVALTEKSVTIKLEGIVRMEAITFNPDGTVKQKCFYTQDNSQGPRAFTFNNALTPGPNGKPSVQSGHKVSDLRMGDVVYVLCTHAKGVDYCGEIEIHRRPGGQVPPAIQDEMLIQLGKKIGKDLTDSRWDVRMNAEQILEEKACAACAWMSWRLLLSVPNP
jgi:hypothetical protein